MLESFTCDTFRPLVGDTFRLEIEGGEPVHAVLVEATELARSSPSEGRAPFSIVFRGPARPVYPQGIYRLGHAGLGAFELFLVPIGPDGGGIAYEAVFT